MESAYLKSIQEKRTEQIRQIAKELPRACGDFLRAISTTTSTLTRLAYAYDLRIFFTFLTAELPQFSDTEWTYFKDADINAITRQNLEQYVEYLTMYYKNMEIDNEAGYISKPIANHELGITRKLSTLRSFWSISIPAAGSPPMRRRWSPFPSCIKSPSCAWKKTRSRPCFSAVQSGDKLSPRQQKYQALTRCRDYAMLCLFLGTGIRVSECVGINLDDIDFSQNAFLVTRKGGNQVMLYFPQEVADALLAYIKERKDIIPLKGHEEALFLSLQKRRITQRAVQNLVKKYALLAAPLKKRISPHKLRSTFGTHLYYETGDIYLVADALGHANVDTTRKHYAAMTEAKRREAPRHVHLPKQQDAEAHDEIPSKKSGQE